MATSRNLMWPFQIDLIFILLWRKDGPFARLGNSGILIVACQAASSRHLLKNKHDPRNYTPSSTKLIRVISCHFGDRFILLRLDVHHFFSNVLDPLGLPSPAAEA